MKGITFEKEQIKSIYDEVERRMCAPCKGGHFAEARFNDERRAMMQGVYAVLSALASNWPEVRHWTDELESEQL